VVLEKEKYMSHATLNTASIKTSISSQSPMKQNVYCLRSKCNNNNKNNNKKKDFLTSFALDLATQSRDSKSKISDVQESVIRTWWGAK